MLKKVGPVKLNENSLSGIIYLLKHKYNIKNPIESGLVVPSATTAWNGNVNTTVLWDSDLWRTYNNPYLQFEFPDGLIYPTGYSFRGVLPGNKYCYGSSWTLYGFNKGEESNTDKWNILSTNTAAEKSYCGATEYCNGNDVATYTINQTGKGYRYLRWKGTGKSCSWSMDFFATSGVDVYGTLAGTKVGDNGQIHTCVPFLFLRRMYLMFLLVFIIT